MSVHAGYPHSSLELVGQQGLISSGRNPVQDTGPQTSAPTLFPVLVLAAEESPVEAGLKLLLGVSAINMCCHSGHFSA